MIADKSTANFFFFIFFQNWYNWGLAARSEQLFTLSSGCRNKLGSLGLRLRKRTIVPRTRQQQDRASLVQLVDLGTGRTIAWNPTGCVACWNPKPEQLFAFTSGQQVLGRETEQLFGLGSECTRLGRNPKSEQWRFSAGLVW